MPDNYDSVCSLCGKAVDEDALYYCCSECRRIHKREDSKVPTEERYSEGSNC